jgi:NADPH2:quinone reductase
MRAILVTSFTGPDALQFQEVPDPSTRPGQVIVDVEAVGLNFADVLGSMGRYPGGPEPPYICGREFAGTVEDTRERVMGYTQYGACAEKIAMSRSLLFPAPPQWGPDLCAAFPVNFLTAWLAYWEAGLVRAEQNDPSPVNDRTPKRVLIHAAAGGVGTAAIQIGKLLGIETYGTASTDEKLETARRLGLTHGINYSREDYEARIKELTNGEGVDAVFDSLAGEHTGKSLRCCGFLGRVILFGSASGERPKFDVMAMYSKSASVHGLWLSKLASNTTLINSALQSMRPWIAEGKLKPLIGAEFPLEKAAEAFRLMQERRSYGKIVLRLK